MFPYLASNFFARLQLDQLHNKRGNEKACASLQRKLISWPRSKKQQKCLQELQHVLDIPDRGPDLHVIPGVIPALDPVLIHLVEEAAVEEADMAEVDLDLRGEIADEVTGNYFKFTSSFDVGFNPLLKSFWIFVNI